MVFSSYRNRQKMSLSRAAFTLVELLVVIAIIGILIGMLLPAVQQVREAARRSACSNKLKQIALASLNYESARNEFPSGYFQIRVGGSFQGHSVFYYLLPFMEQNALYEMMDAKVPANNRAATAEGGLSASSLTTLLCPSDTLPAEPDRFPATGTPREFYARSSYRACAGSRAFYSTSATNDGMFMMTGSGKNRHVSGAPDGHNTKIGQVSDGLSNTILFGERSHKDDNFNTFTTAGLNSGRTIEAWSRWYPSFNEVSISYLFVGAFSPINYKTPWAHGQPGAPTSQNNWYQFQDQRLGAIGSEHPGGANMVYGDGSVHFVSENLPQNILQLYCAKADGEVIPTE